MTRSKAQEIIHNEGLTDIVWFEVPTNFPESVAIYRSGDEWVVSTTDERAVELAIQRFENEGDALEEVIERSRAGKHLI